MKITICGSMLFSEKMQVVAKELEGLNHTVFLPQGTNDYINIEEDSVDKVEGAKKKIANNLIRSHFNLINNSDAILVINEDKKDIKNYIGGNSFLEIGFAYILDKKIFLLNNVPDISLIQQEVIAMQPIILNGDLRKIE